MSDIERDYVNARDLIRKAEASGVFDDDDDRHALRDAVKRLHGRALQARGAVARADALQTRLDAIVAACDEFAGPMHIRAIATGHPDTGGQ